MLLICQASYNIDTPANKSKGGMLESSSPSLRTNLSPIL